MLRLSFQRADLADAIEQAVRRALADGPSHRRSRQARPAQHRHARHGRRRRGRAVAQALKANQRRHRASTRDRLPRSLHDQPAAARGLPPAAGRGAARLVAATGEGLARHHRRRDPRERGTRADPPPARARHRPHAVLAAGCRHGTSPRRRDDQPVLVGALQRTDPSRVRTLSAALRRRVPASAEPRRHRPRRAFRSSSAASTSSASSAAT